MRIELLGSGGFHPNERRHTLCLFLPELGVMLDAGTAAFRVHGRLRTPQLDVVLTHAHLDHTAGLTHLLLLHHEGQPARVRLHAAPNVIDAVRETVFAEAAFPVPTIDEFCPLGDGPITLHAGAKLTTFPLRHPGGALGIRIDHAGGSMALVTDTTEPTETTIEQIRGVDLLFHEAYFDEAMAKLAEASGHCTARQAAETAVAARVKRLVLVHRDPRATDDATPLTEARAVYPAADYGEDGQTFDV